MTRPEISLAVLNQILARQDGHIPMRPSDMAQMARSLDELRDSIDELRTALSGVEARRTPVGPFHPVVVPFPGRARA